MEIWSEKKVSKRVQWVFLWFSLVQIRKKKSEAPPQFLTPAPHSSAWAISTSAACDERPSTDWQILCFTPRYRWPSWQHLVPWSGPVENTSPKEGAQSGFVLICHTSISSVHLDIYLEPIKKNRSPQRTDFPFRTSPQRCIFTFPKCLNHGMLGEIHEAA